MLKCLADYDSSSDCSEGAENHIKYVSTEQSYEPVLKKPKVSPPPPLFDNVAGVESTKKHDGRTRSFAHVRGNWPSHIFVEGICIEAYFHTIMVLFLVHSLPNKKV